MVLQVVLPDPKGGDKDTVVFLDEAQAAPSPEEAQERAAVAALVRVAGHRNMQRLLPKAYEAAWEWCVKKVTKPPSCLSTFQPSSCRCAVYYVLVQPELH